MRILCPIDFSTNAVHALHWTVNVLDTLGGGTLEIVHCIIRRSRAGMFIRLDDLIEKEAIKDLDELSRQVVFMSDRIEVLSNVIFHEPKTYISTYAKNHNFDLIVTGTKGLSAIKEMTVGSVTEWAINNSEIPVIAVPEEAPIGQIKKIVFGFKENIDTSLKNIQLLKKLLLDAGASLDLVHVSDQAMQFDEGYLPDPALQGVDFKHTSISCMNGVAKCLSDYCFERKANILCLIHKRQNWLERMFQSSVTKRELFDLHLPLLVFPQD